jgi:predicted dehydrogenase/poly(3-hydroxybutyrate) depolymerase
MRQTTRVKNINWGIVGVGGWGRQHLAAIRKLEQSGQTRLLCVCDPTLHRFPDLEQEFANNKTRVYHNLAEMLSGEPELTAVTIAAPIPLHDQMTRLCLNREQLFIYLEKPPVPMIGQLDELLALDRDNRIGVAFQMVMAPWSRQIKQWLITGALGELKEIKLTACWPRPDQYYHRAPWAGKMNANGEAVFDGPATNGLSHLIHNAMYFASNDPDGFAEPLEIQGELYRARPIESYDTCCMRGKFTGNARFFAALTHAVKTMLPFQIEITGSTGWARTTENDPTLRSNLGDFNCHQPADNLMTDSYQAFIDYITGQRQRPPTLLRDTRGYVLATNALLRSSRGINDIDPARVKQCGEGENRIYHIEGIDDTIADSLRRPQLFSERALPWSVKSKPVKIENLPVRTQTAPPDNRRLREEFQALTHTSKIGGTMPYRLLPPKPLVAGKKYPVILFFHGAGDRGNDNTAQLNHCLHRFTEPANRQQYPCFVIAPQCPLDKQWVDAYIINHPHTRTRPAQAGEEMRLALEILQHVQTTFTANIDPCRLYLTGLSMGGYAVWDCLTRFPEKIAAAIPICGGGDTGTITAQTAQIPLWAFHSSDDIWVDVNTTRRMITALRTAGGRPNYTEYDNYGHPSWEPAYAEPELFPWIFNQQKSH